jgi:hypothetical protein
MKYFVLLCSVFLLSCSAEKNIISDYTLEGFDITRLRGSSLRLHVNPVVDLREYKKFFEMEYPSTMQFNTSLTDKLKEALGKFSPVSIDKDVQMDSLFLNQPSSERRTALIKRIFENAHEDYAIGIKRVVLFNSITQEPSQQVSSSTVNTKGQRGTTETTRTVEGKIKVECVIQMNAEVWSVKEMKKVTEFTSIGQSPVFLLSFGVAINKALEYSVIHLSDYVKEKEE